MDGFGPGPVAGECAGLLTAHAADAAPGVRKYAEIRTSSKFGLADPLAFIATFLDVSSFGCVRMCRFEHPHTQRRRLLLEFPWELTNEDCALVLILVSVGSTWKARTKEHDKKPTTLEFPRTQTRQISLFF